MCGGQAGLGGGVGGVDSRESNLILYPKIPLLSILIARLTMCTHQDLLMYLCVHEFIVRK